jgi:hypothetical protein
MSYRERSEKEPVAAMPLHTDGVQDPVLNLGKMLADDAMKRAREKNISFIAAFREIAGELPEPYRGYAREVIDKQVSRAI